MTRAREGVGSVRDSFYMSQMRGLRTPGERGVFEPGIRGARRMDSLKPMFLGWHGNRLESGTPTALAHFVWVDKIVGGFPALLAFERHGPRHTAYVQSAGERLPLHPFGEFHGHVAIRIGMSFFRSEERPGAKQQRQAYHEQDHQQRQENQRGPLRPWNRYDYNPTLALMRRNVPVVVRISIRIGYVACRVGDSNLDSNEQV